MFRVMIKGTPVEARRAAARRAIPMRVVGKGSFNHVIGRVGAQHELKIVKWFCEDPASPPFPPGTLLFYNPWR